jgi:hypothetical protein
MGQVLTCDLCGEQLNSSNPSHTAGNRLEKDGKRMQRAEVDRA